MKTVFHEDFQTRCGDLPSGWSIERTSDLTISAAALGDQCLEFLSAGNKYLPVTPALTDGEMTLTFACNYAMPRRFEIYVLLPLGS